MSYSKSTKTLYKKIKILKSVLKFNTKLPKTSHLKFSNLYKKLIFNHFKNLNNFKK